MSILPNKTLGQHFLHDAQVVARIAESIEIIPHACMVEIGPGTGVLTRALLERGARLTVIELDSRCWAVLDALAEEFSGQLMVVRGDALQVDWDGLLCGKEGIRGSVVGNLPYNVGTELVQLLSLPNPPRQMVFMLQKEVVQRICATPDTRDWGRLGVLCQLLADCRKLFDVAPGAFTPPPKVMSSVVRLTPLPAPRFAVSLTALDGVLRLMFGQRRKMLRSVLKGRIREAQLVELGIQPTWRGEVLELEAICKLANQISPKTTT